jgi:hypothetical protein
MKFFKANIAIVLTLSVLVIISACFNISYASQNKKYKDYLSEQIGNMLRPMGEKINDAKVVLEKANESGSISKDDMNSLYNCYNTFAFGTQDLFHLYLMVGKHKYIIQQPSYYFEAYRELEIINRNVQSMNDSVHKLTDSDKESFKWIQKITNNYVNIFGTDYKSWDFTISKNKWFDTIKQIDLVNNKTIQ